MGLFSSTNSEIKTIESMFAAVVTLIFVVIVCSAESIDCPDAPNVCDQDSVFANCTQLFDLGCKNLVVESDCRVRCDDDDFTHCPYSWSSCSDCIENGCVTFGNNSCAPDCGFLADIFCTSDCGAAENHDRCAQKENCTSCTEELLLPESSAERCQWHELIGACRAFPCECGSSSEHCGTDTGEVVGTLLTGENVMDAVQSLLTLIGQLFQFLSGTLGRLFSIGNHGT